MPDPAEISQAISNFFPRDVVNQLVSYVGYALVGVIIFAFFMIVYYMVVYKYKVTYPILHFNDAEKKSAAIIRYKTDRACDKKTRQGVKKQRLLFKRLVIEPFKETDIHPGNRVNLLKINDDGTHIAMPNLRFSNPVSEFETLSPEEKFWAVLQLQENAKTFQNDDAQRRIFLMTLATVVLCLVMVGITVWLSVKAPGQIASSFDKWGQGFLNVAQNMGGTPSG